MLTFNLQNLVLFKIDSSAWPYFDLSPNHLAYIIAKVAGTVKILRKEQGDAVKERRLLEPLLKAKKWRKQSPLNFREP